jgi:hypothetical protein
MLRRNSIYHNMIVNSRGLRYVKETRAVWSPPSTLGRASMEMVVLRYGGPRGGIENNRYSWKLTEQH